MNIVNVRILHNIVRYPIIVIAIPIQCVALGLKCIATGLNALSQRWGEFLIKKCL
jgi:hypothetical protein